MKKTAAVLILLLLLSVFACSKGNESKEKKAVNTTNESKKAGEIENEASHFGFMPAAFDYAEGKKAGGNWDRPFFDLFEWGLIEQEPGVFDFSRTDEYVKEAQRNGYNTLANIQPFAPWDQKANEGKYPEVESMDPQGAKTRAKPNDMKAYANFVKKLVERYDGDSKSDMPGLKYPIKYWEVANEPEMQEPPLAFFQGPPKDYVEVLKATYEEVKSADSEAKVLSGGMAGMSDFMTKYWQGVFDAGGSQYFDIANIHSIGHGEPLNIPEYKEFLAKNNINKPIWVTEVQIEGRKDKKTEEYYAESLARSYIFALANGIDKLFYVNLKLPQGGLPPEEKGGPGFSDLSTLISQAEEEQPLFYTHKTIAEILDQPFTVEKIREDVSDSAAPEGNGGNRRILVGQYKFIINGKTIYALWGDAEIPVEIGGKVRVTYLDGKTKELDAGELVQDEGPIFIEKL